MLSKILSLFSGSSLDGWVKGIILVCALIVAAVLGYQLAARSYRADIAEMQAELQADAQRVAEANLKEAKESAKKLSDAIAARDNALRELDAARGDADGLREQLASFERRVSSAGPSACKFEREQLAGCVRLLSEGADLASEGARLAGRIAVDKDAIAAIK